MFQFKGKEASLMYTYGENVVIYLFKKRVRKY